MPIDIDIHSNDKKDINTPTKKTKEVKSVEREETDSKSTEEKVDFGVPSSSFFRVDYAVYMRLKQLYDEVIFVDIAENAFELSAKNHKGKVVLPLITVTRLGDFSLATEYYNDLHPRLGFPHNTGTKVEFPEQRVRVHNIPCTLTYQIDVWAPRRDVCDGIASELLLEFKERPYVKAKIQDLGIGAKSGEFDFLIDDSVTDNTSISEFPDTGRFYRLTLNGVVPNGLVSRVDIFNKIEKSTIDIDGFSPTMIIEDEEFKE